MKYVLLLMLISMVATDPCMVSQEDCETMTTQYEKYRECMEKRSKRSIDCDNESDNSCEDCDCSDCSYSSCSSCKNNNCCNQCCQRNSCTSYSCCHKSCRAECKSNACRTSCKRKCQEAPGSYKISNEPIISDTRTANQHNITTVIHLNNVINNTNLINLPINVNNTVLNNITNGGRSYNGEYSNIKDNCCKIIGPRQCVPQNSFPFVRCFHVRKKACGSVCLAPVVHYQKHEICDNDVNVQQPCRQQTIYIPQPQPRCAYQQSWPYVNCGNQQTQSCEGCYSHYIKREDVTKCSNYCYDDGYGIGPYYRQGPFYRPGFAHTPSCYQTGTCGVSDGFNYGYQASNELTDNNFLSAYPSQTYAFAIENCENCTDEFNEQNFNSDATLPPWDSRLEWNSPSQMVNLEGNVNPERTLRYAEIRIRPTSKIATTTSTSVEATNTTTITTISI